MKRKIKSLRKIVEKHANCNVYNGNCGTGFGEILCAHIHSPINMPFKILAKHFKMTLEELAGIVFNHIKRL